eukprot:gnl/TRDRNA2_/TRDRNA2_183282_c0_seq1.p1 gnl/TRDRNA2_/TRDRNA2_183282_c0~~gnl/TRDRNA2_/TRDRNA2_183282_c0_seq1.p1  ORF type:complete len:216 (+),score=77.28 gnl/TRDRNA2_/TRDRNA2_183282_c0_seq1:58-705(+)
MRLMLATFGLLLLLCPVAANPMQCEVRDESSLLQRDTFLHSAAAKQEPDLLSEEDLSSLDDEEFMETDDVEASLADSHEFDELDALLEDDLDDLGGKEEETTAEQEAAEILEIKQLEAEAARKKSEEAAEEQQRRKEFSQQLEEKSKNEDLIEAELKKSSAYKYGAETAKQFTKIGSDQMKMHSGAKGEEIGKILDGSAVPVPASLPGTMPAMGF